MNKDMIVLVGQTGSGKTTIAKALEKRGYKRIITYTTRPLRKRERNGIDYHFVTEDVFSTMIDLSELAEYTEYDALFGHVYYGSAKKDYLAEGRKVIVLNPDGLSMIKRNRVPHFSVLLDIPEEEILKRTINRGDSVEEVKRRLDADKEKFDSVKEMVDLVIGMDTVENIVTKIIS